MPVCVCYCLVQYTVRASPIQAMYRLRSTVWLCVIYYKKEHFVDIIGQWINVNCYHWGLHVLSMCQTVDWCVNELWKSVRHLWSFVLIPDIIYTEANVAGSWPYAVHSWWYFHIKPEKSNENNRKNRCGLFWIKIGYFFTAKYTWTAWKTRNFTEMYPEWVKNHYSLLCLLVFVFREKVEKAFIDACLYVKDRMEEVSSPDKEMVRIYFRPFDSSKLY